MKNLITALALTAIGFGALSAASSSDSMAASRGCGGKGKTHVVKRHRGKRTPASADMAARKGKKTRKHARKGKKVRPNPAPVVSDQT